MEITVNMAWLEAILLSSIRIVGFILIAPPFSYKAFPGRVKAMLAIALAIAVSPKVVPGFTALETGPLIGAAVMEFCTGAALGFLVFLCFAAIQSAGNFIDMFSGFQMAQGFDPQSMVNGAQFTKLFQMTALALLLASDGYQLVLGGLMRSFTAIGPGAGINMAVTAEQLTTGMGQMFLSAVQIAGPLMVVLFLTDVGLGLLTRVAPALNAFALGFPLKIFVTLSLATTVFMALPRVVSSLTKLSAETLMGVR